MPNDTPDWPSRGKSIAQLIRELQSFEDQTIEARISVDGGRTSLPISLVGRLDNAAVLLNAETTPSVRRHE
jgi:hypothetical protein